MLLTKRVDLPQCSPRGPQVRPHSCNNLQVYLCLHPLFRFMADLVHQYLTKTDEFNPQRRAPYTTVLRQRSSILKRRAPRTVKISLVDLTMDSDQCPIAYTAHKMLCCLLRSSLDPQLPCLDPKLLSHLI